MLALATQQLAQASQIMAQAKLKCSYLQVIKQLQWGGRTLEFLQIFKSHSWFKLFDQFYCDPNIFDPENFTYEMKSNN